MNDIVGDTGAVRQHLFATLERLLSIEAAEVQGTVDGVAQPSWRYAEALQRAPFAPAEGRRILLVNNESDMRDAMRVSLERQGYIVLQAADETEAVAKVRTALPDLVVLEASSPMMDGMAALHEIRLCSAVPVIMLTLNGDEDAKVQALRLGADEYVTAPCSQRELLAHIESMLRRSTQTGSVPQETIAVDDDLTIDFARNRVILRGTENPLTATEHRLLYHLVSNAGRLMPFEALLARVWGPDYREEVHYVRLYVSYLRAKIEPDPAHPKYILIEKGLGYRFTALEREPARQLVRRDVSDPAWHELRTLVAMVRAYIGTLLPGIERGGDREGVRILRHIEARATRLLNMVDNLLEMQRIQSGMLALDESWFDLCELASGVAEEFQATTQTHRLVVDSTEPVLVRADRRRIGMVLSNLLENAIDYSPDGGVITGTVRLGRRPDGRGTQAVMAVSDQGVGIMPADLPHVFERYFQTAGGRPRDGARGLGAGLFVARGIARQHGGTMWVKSGGSGTGSTFYLTLPI